MSVQNTLQKPAFTKSVMGYTTGEVDRYVEHVSERYNSVCRENAELKRRVMSLGVRLDEIESKLAEREENSVTKKVLDKSALRDIFAMLEEEKRRYAAYLDSLMDKLNSIAAEDADYDESDVDDSAWEVLLDSFIEEASPEDDSVEEKAVEQTLPDVEEEVCRVAVPDEQSAPEVQSDETEEPAEDAASAPTVQKTPAEIAAELDFYTDNVYRDGESFDPMTLAAQITAKKNKPTFEDFMKPLPADGDKNTKNKNK